MSQYLAPLGRLGNQLKIKPLSAGLEITGWRDADLTAEFVAGMVGKVAVNSDGITCVTPVTAVTDKPAGIFYCDRINTFYSSVYKEIVAIAADGTFLASKPYVKSGTLRIRTTDASPAACVVTTDYTVTSLTNGSFKIAAGGKLAAATTVELSYMYTDTEKSGFSNVDGSGKAAFVEGNGELAILIYDPAADYVVGSPIYFTADGYVTATQGSSAVSFGTITKAPTNEDPELRIKVIL